MSNWNNSNASNALITNIKETYDAFKSKLLIVCKEIELSLSTYQSQYNKSIANNKTKSMPSIHPRNNISHQIRNTSLLTEEIDKKIKTILTLDQIESKEEELFLKKNKLIQLESENKSLLTIQKCQLKGFIKYQNQINVHKEEIEAFKEKQNELKQSMSSKKKMERETESIIKGQVAQMNSLNTKCNIIRDNIAYKRKNELMGISIDNINSSEDKNASVDSKLAQLKFALLNQEEIFDSTNNYSCHIIRNQKENINRLNDEISVLAQTVNGLNREIKAKEIRTKEMQRKKQSKQRIKSFKLSKNYSINTIMKNNIKPLSNISMPNIKYNSISNSYQNISNSHSISNSLCKRSTDQKHADLNRIVNIYNQHLPCKVTKTNEIISQIQSLSTLYIIYNNRK